MLGSDLLKKVTILPMRGHSPYSSRYFKCKIGENQHHNGLREEMNY